MSVIIHNISEGNNYTGLNHYELLINRKHICFFDHDRTHDGLAQCLRDAADAVDATDGVEPPNKLSLSEVAEILAKNKDSFKM